MNTPINNGLARAIVAITILNLNGLTYMLLGISQVFSIALLFFSVALLFSCRRVILSWELVLYLSWVVGYLFFGLLYIPLFNDSQADIRDGLTVVGTIVLTLSIAVYLQNVRDPETSASFFRFARNLLIVSATANLFSPFLYSIYAHPPPSADYRNAGFFANPNDAAITALFAVIMLLLFPFKSRLVQLVALGLVSFATVITFSRGPISVLFFIFLLISWMSRPAIRFLSIPVSIVILVGFYASLGDLRDWLNTQAMFDLSPQQLVRLLSILAFLGGEVDTETTGARSELFDIALDKAMSVFPLGTGLNSFQAMEGGLLGFSNNWLGAHNSFLMIWGEAGILVLIAMLAFIVVTAFKSYRSPNGGIRALLLPLLLVACSMSNHEILSLRFMNIATAFLIMQRMAIFAGSAPRNATESNA